MYRTILHNNNKKGSNFMKKAFILLTSILCLCLVGCSTSSTATQKLTAEQICEKLKSSGLPVMHIVSYTSDNDQNKLLGRPNQYISKSDFIDSRYSSSYDRLSKEKDFNQLKYNYECTVETFNTKEDMQTRYNYVNGFIKQGGMFAQYMYNTDTAILRLSKDLTPAQAKEYQDKFLEIAK